MAFTFPLSRAQFFDLLPLSSGHLVLPDTTRTSRTQGGEILRAEYAARLWEAELRLGPMTADEAAAVLPLVHLLGGAGASFMLADATRLFPRRDPTGGLLGSAAPALNSIGANRRDITLKGLPAGYILSRRDLLAFTYGATPTRYALHEIVNAQVTANPDGTTPAIEVVPPVREGAAVDAPVTLKRPACKAIIVPRSFQSGSMRSGTITEGVSFRVQQTLR